MELHLLLYVVLKEEEIFGNQFQSVSQVYHISAAELSRIERQRKVTMDFNTYQNTGLKLEKSS